MTVIIDPDSNLTLDDLDHLDAIDDAETQIEQAIVLITTQLADASRVSSDPEWAFAANHALKAKKFALRAIQRKRGQLKREHQNNWRDAFISQVRIMNPSLFDMIMDQVHTP